MNLLKSQHGDTIVEVMIALLLLSTVLVSSFALSNVSQHSIRGSAEHDQAVQLAKTQIEFLRVNNGMDTTHNSCFDVSGQPQATDNSQCNFSSNGTSACDLATSAYCYTVAITVVADTSGSPSPQSASTYNVAISWDKVTGGTGNVDMLYRPYVSAPNAADVQVDDLEGDDDNPDDVVADLSHGGCAVVATCGLPGKVSYNILFHFVTTTLNPSDIDHCTWVWGDGTQNTYAGATLPCKIGGHIMHNYPDTPGYKTGTVCTIGNAKPGTKKYTARLDVYKASGSKISSSTMNAWVYYCAKA